ncbi:hypothetical protein [Roseovarius salis]|uniref:hypothetical protein n=1 Tax=Roseovarius salis TaxID=3376063 RepID=UPI0037C67C18
MVKKAPRDKSAAAQKDSRETRLKAALKANMARRKAQARARKRSEQGGDAAESKD